jgi:hypothetical protein
MGTGDLATTPIDLTDDLPSPSTSTRAPRGRKRKAEPAEPSNEMRASRKREYVNVETIDLTNVKPVRSKRMYETIARNSRKATIPVLDMPSAPRRSRVGVLGGGMGFDLDDGGKQTEPLANPDGEKRLRR